ncbi:MAG: aminotransferase class IV [Dehalococcoidia bacterium]
MPSPIVYLNGRYVAADQASVSVFDHGLLLGHGVFETMRAYGGAVFRIDEHLARLVRGAEEVGILLGGERSALEQAVTGVLQANRLADARVRLTVTAGPGPGRPVFPATGQPTVIVTAEEMPPPPKTYEHGYRVIVASRTRSSQSALAAIKSTSFLENLLARADAQVRGADEAIILNEQRCVAECSQANVFFVQRARLLTPAPECGILRGIARETVIQLATDAGMSVEQTWITMEEMAEASEAFATSSMIEVMPVTTIDGRPVGDGRPGEVTRLLARAYRDLVAHELGLGRR